jgi:hypothetical protein
MNYLQFSLPDGDWEFIIEVLEATLEMAEQSKDPEAARVRKHLTRLVGTLNVQLIMAQDDMGDIPTH